jgi:GTP diphosphokinase / guanosine-3',5'-bis(diphosphate) 3'-diphosphatase
MPEEIKQRLSFAITLAAMAHGDTLDKGGALYLLHPLRVMREMTTEEEMMVAVLHDVVEDTHVKMEFIYRHFPKPVADAIEAISRRDGESYFDYIQRVRVNELARKVKLADLRDNISPERIAKLPILERKITKRYKEALDILS